MTLNRQHLTLGEKNAINEGKDQPHPNTNARKPDVSCRRLSVQLFGRGRLGFDEFVLLTQLQLLVARKWGQTTINLGAAQAASVGFRLIVV